MNAIKQYEIDLRGNKLGAIENLGATENQFDSIDLSDNAIIKVEGFPKLPRLKMLLLNNNKVLRVTKNLENALPNLETLILTNNKFSNLSDLDTLATLPKLSVLSLMGCPVATKPNYRAYLISKCKHLRMLDFRKVKQRDRQEADKLFGSAVAAEAHAAKTFEPSEDYQKAVEPSSAAQQVIACSVVAPVPGSAGCFLTLIKSSCMQHFSCHHSCNGPIPRRPGHLPACLLLYYSCRLHDVCNW